MTKIVPNAGMIWW